MNTQEKLNELFAQIDADENALRDSLSKLQTEYDAKKLEYDKASADTDAVLQGLQKQINDYQSQLSDSATITADLKKQLADAKAAPATVVQSNVKRGIIGFNIHLFSDTAYSDVNKVIKCLQDLNIKHVRQDFKTDANGKILQHDDLVNRILPLFKAAGIEIHPMVYLTGQSLNTTDLQAEYNKGFALFAGFATLYSSYFKTIEIGNENAIKILLPNTAGDKKEHYSSLGLPAMCSFIKGAYFGILSVNTAIKQYVSNEWIHTYFVYALRVVYGVCTYISHHMYTDGYWNIAKQPGWTGLSLDGFLKKNWGEACDEIGETNFLATTNTPYTEQTHVDKFMPLFNEIYSQGYNIFLYELLDRVNSTGREGVLGFYKSDGTPKLIVAEIKKVLGIK